MGKSTLIILVVAVVLVLGVVYGTGLLKPEESELSSIESGLPAREPLSQDIQVVGETVTQELLIDADLVDPLNEEDDSLIEEDPSAYEDDSFSDFDF